MDSDTIRAKTVIVTILMVNTKISMIESTFLPLMIYNIGTVDFYDHMYYVAIISSTIIVFFITTVLSISLSSFS